MYVKPDLLLYYTWFCPFYQAERKPALDRLPDDIENLPQCFKIATIVSKDLYIHEQDLHTIQDSLVIIWQKHIQAWNEHKHPDFFVSQSNTQLSAFPEATSQPVAKKGHVLKNIPDGGVFCCKCVRQVKRTEHIRLKILNKPCTYPTLPESEWLSEPGAINSALRWNDAEKHMNEVHNTGHRQIAWNRQVGRVASQPKHGLLWRAKCDKTFSWKNRH